MAKRTIKLGLGTYIDKHGNSRWGYRGDEVDVNDEYLKDFDAINLETGDGKVPVEERVGVEVVSPSTAADESDEKPEPKKSAAKKA